MGIVLSGGSRAEHVSRGQTSAAPDQGERVSMARVLAALGFAPTDCAGTRESPLAQQRDASCASDLDAIVYKVRRPNGFVEDAIRTCDGVLVDVSGPPIEALLTRPPEYSARSCPPPPIGAVPTP